jgi:hypothetical protein
VINKNFKRVLFGSKEDYMDRPELYLSGGAFIIAGGSFFYLNSKIGTIEESLSKVIDRLGTLAITMGQHDDINKITSAKLSDFGTELRQVQSGLLEVKNAIGDELTNMSMVISKQNKRIKKIVKSISHLESALGASPSLDIDEEPELSLHIEPAPNKKAAKSLVPTSVQRVAKPIATAKEKELALEQDVLTELNALELQHGV